MAKYQRKKNAHISEYRHNIIRVYRMACTVYVFILYSIWRHAAVMQAPRVRAIGPTVNNDIYIVITYNNSIIIALSF